MSSDAQIRDRRSVSRRSMLVGLATGGATVLAGCTGGDRSDVGLDDSRLGAAHAEPDDLRTFVGPMFARTIHAIQFNRWNRRNRVRPVESVLFERGVRYDPLTQSFYSRIVVDWELRDERTVAVDLGEGYHWQDDDAREVGAIDLVAQERLSHLVGGDRIYELDLVVAEGDRTVVYEFREPVNRQTFAHSYLTQPFWVQSERYRSFLTALDATEGDTDGRTELRRSLAEFVQDAGVGNSVWKLDEVATDRVAFTAVEEHPDAERLSFSEYWLVSNAGLDRGLLAIGANTQDAVNFPHDTTLDDFDRPIVPDQIVQYPRTTFRGRAIAFHHEHEPFDDPRVRRAIAAVVDVEDLAASRDAWGLVPATAPWGLAGHANDVPRDVVGELADAFPAAGPDEQRAVAQLESAGFDRVDGEWYTSTGDRFELHLVWNTDDQIRLLLEAQLRSFGIGVHSEKRVDVTEGPVSIERYTNALEDGLFDVIEIGWGTRVPIDGFRQVWGPDSPLRRYDVGWATAIDSLPTPFDGAGEISVDAREILDDAQAEGDPSRYDDHLRLLAWAFAHDLPFLPLYEFSASVILNTETVSVVDWDPATSLLDHVRAGRIVPSSRS